MISVERGHIITEGNGIDLLGEASLAAAVAVKRVSHGDNEMAISFLISLIQTAGDVLNKEGVDIDLKLVGRYLSVYGGGNDSDN